MANLETIILLVALPLLCFMVAKSNIFEGDLLLSVTRYRNGDEYFTYSNGTCQENRCPIGYSLGLQNCTRDLNLRNQCKYNRQMFNDI